MIQQLPIYKPVYVPRELKAQPAAYLVAFSNKKFYLSYTDNMAQAWQELQHQFTLRNDRKMWQLLSVPNSVGRLGVPFVYYTNQPANAHTQFCEHLDYTAVDAIVNLAPFPLRHKTISAKTLERLHRCAQKRNGYECYWLALALCPQSKTQRHTYIFSNGTQQETCANLYFGEQLRQTFSEVFRTNKAKASYFTNSAIDWRNVEIIINS